MDGRGRGYSSRDRNGPKGGGRFGLRPGQRPVSEASRIDIVTQLENFQRSLDIEVTFPPDLSNHDRAIVHAECKKLGLHSKSTGKGESRAVTVFKKPSSSRQPGGAAKTFCHLPLSDPTVSSLDSYFASYPPTEDELVQAATTEGHDGNLQAAYGSGAADDDNDDSGGSGSDGDDNEPEEKPVQQQQDSNDSNIKKSSQDKKRKTPASNNKSKTNRGKKRMASHFTEQEVAKRHTIWQDRITRDPQVASLQTNRSSLPIAAHKEEIISAIHSNQVIMIAGETGCGKTTQVPQYLLEDSWSKGKAVKALCTQPRRISAVSVADRVAAERGESTGENVGYTIRLESKGGPECSLMFATNGVVLRMMTAGSHRHSHRVGEGDDVANDEDEVPLSGITHLIIDEIHERDRFADFLLILIKDLLPQRPDLRVILMSATLHVDLFAGYFQGCPVISVPGFTHSVQDFYLEEILKLTGYQESAVAELAAAGFTGSSVGITQDMVTTARSYGNGGSGKGQTGDGSSLSPEDKEKIEAAIEAAFTEGGYEEFDILMELTGAGDADNMGTALGNKNNNAIMSPGINIRHPVTGATALMAAAAHGRVEVLAVLLANGADPRIRAENGYTARDIAEEFDQPAAVEALDALTNEAAAAEELANSALALSHYQSNTDTDEVDLLMIRSLLEFVCGEGKFKEGSVVGMDGDTSGDAVLIFLPGWDEIVRLKELLESSGEGGTSFANSAKYSILPLHSLVAPADQRKVFQRPAAGVRKIVLSTNIAETSITIDDVVFVIDSGRLKEKSFDPYTGVSTLQSNWISKASERQRRGRAGRCRPGFAFHLYSRTRSSALQEFQLPEIQRSPLDEMGLQVKLLETPMQPVIGIADFLGKAVEPPVPQAVTAAIELLTDIGALDDAEHLTSLGRHLAALPLQPALGKLLLYGVLFECLDPVLTVACCMAYRDPWVLPPTPALKNAAVSAKLRFSGEAGGASDHLAAVQAYNGWRMARSKGYGGADRRYCAENFVSPSTMNMIDGMREQLLKELKSRGFVMSLESASQNAAHYDLVRSILSCGFYPLIGRLAPMSPRDQKARPALTTRRGEKVRLHPTSITTKWAQARERSKEVVKLRENEENGHVGNDEVDIAVLGFYDEITRGDAVTYVKSITMVGAHPALLVAAHIGVEYISNNDDVDNDGNKGGDGVEGGDNNNSNNKQVRPRTAVEKSLNGMRITDIGGGGLSDVTATTTATIPLAPPTAEGNATEQKKKKEKEDVALLVVDNWLRFRVPATQISHIMCLRLRIAEAFAAKVKHPSTPLPPSLANALLVASAMFSRDKLDTAKYAEHAGSCTAFGAGFGGRERGRGGFGGRGGGGGREQEVCRHFASFGNCRYGDACGYKHEFTGGGSRGGGRGRGRGGGGGGGGGGRDSFGNQQPPSSSAAVQFRSRSMPNTAAAPTSGGGGGGGVKRNWSGSERGGGGRGGPSNRGGGRNMGRW
jgi:ATP-dependent RNA helicase DHX36